MPWDANAGGDIFGGWLMSQMDLGASVVARQRAMGRTATVACDGLQFLKPVMVGDLVSIHADLVSEGRSSMRISVEVWVRRQIYEDHVKVTEAMFTFVALDEAGNTRKLPLQP
ncbi:MAG: acyl-CoA thioesterase [Pseudomonadota bacterium]